MRVVTLPFVDPILYKPVSVHFNKYNDFGDGFWTGKGWKKPGNPVIQLLTILKYDIIDKIHQMCLQR